MVANIVFAPITPLLIGPLNDAVAEAVARNFPVLGDQIRQVPELVEYAFIRLVGPLLSAIGGAGQAHSEIFYSMTTWRIEPFIEAIVKAPFHVIDGLLFGGYGDLGPILPGREGQYIPAPGLLTPWGQPPPVRDIKTPNDIITTTTVPDANANLVSLVTDPADSAAENEIAVTDDPGETVTAEADAPETTRPAKPAKKDPAAGIRQGIKDFRDNVGRTVKKLTGGGTSSHSDSPSGGEKKESTTSESAGSGSPE